MDEYLSIHLSPQEHQWTGRYMRTLAGLSASEPAPWFPISEARLEQLRRYAMALHLQIAAQLAQPVAV